MFLSAFLLGLISSFHCVGMCGPLAMSVPVQHLPNSQQRLSILLYHLGRIVTYSLLGLFFGVLGRHIFIAGIQQKASIILGIIILLVVIYQRIFTKSFNPPFIQVFTDKLYSIIRILWGKHSISGTYLIGMANGLLPCGMVYFAIAGALSSVSVLDSIYFMFLFGVGTLPLMLSVHFTSTSILSFSFRSKARKLVPFFLATLGVLLILRGLNLGIPFISPQLAAEGGIAIPCH